MNQAKHFMKTQNPNISTNHDYAIRSEPEVQSSEFKVHGSGSGVPGRRPRAQVILSDGRHGVRAQLQVNASAPAPDEIKNQNSNVKNSPEPAVLDFVASDDTLDRYGEILVPAGWRLDNYRRNPVFQNAHQYGDIIFTLGKALITEVRAGHPDSPHAALRNPHLYQRIEFAVEANPMARIAYALYRGRFLNAVSVGFIPLRWEDDAPSSSSSSSSSDPVLRRYLEQELLEVSAVGIPANPAALQLGLEAGAIEKADLRELLEVLRCVFDSKCKGEGSTAASEPATMKVHGVMGLAGTLALPNPQPFRSNTAGVDANTSALGEDANGAQLLRLARALRELLRRH